jgi:hypothetical protein
MKSLRVILGCLISTLLTSAASASLSYITDKIPLNSLPGGSLVVGNKEFSEFNLDIIVVDGGATISDPNMMTVQGVQDGTTGDYGLRFNDFTWSVVSNQIITVDLSFKVSILPDPNYEDYFIKDVWLYLTGAGAAGTGVVYAGENIWDTFPMGNNIASLSCSIWDGGARLSDYAEFAPFKEIQIQTKYISVTGGANGSAHFSEFFQFYGQVPEPATVCLLGLGTLGLIRRKRNI